MLEVEFVTTFNKNPKSTPLPALYNPPGVYFFPTISYVCSFSDVNKVDYQLCFDKPQTLAWCVVTCPSFICMHYMGYTCNYIVFCVGGSNTPPVLYLPYGTRFSGHMTNIAHLGRHMTNIAHLGESHYQYITLLGSRDEYAHFSSLPNHTAKVAKRLRYLVSMTFERK